MSKSFDQLVELENEIYQDGDAPFDEESVRLYFQRLRHNKFGLTELVAYDPKSKNILASGLFNNEDAFAESCCHLDGKGNVYAGRNPRTELILSDKNLKENQMYQDGRCRASESYVEFITAVALDIDPIRPKGTSSTLEQYREALDFASVLTEYIGGSVDATGNGACIMIPINPISIDNPKEIKSKCKAWEDSIRKKYQPGNHGLVIDSIHDLARLQKVIGTLSVKGEEHRRTRFYTQPCMEPHPELDEIIIDMEVEAEEQRKVEIKEVTQELPGIFQYFLDTDETLSKHWNTPNEEDDSSGHDWRLGLLCIERGIVNPETLASILALSLYGKTAKHGMDEGYLKRTVSGIFEEYKSEQKESKAKEQIASIRSDKKAAGAKRFRIARVVREDLFKRGDFIKTTHARYYFLRDRKKLMKLDEIDFIALLNKDYGLVEGENDYNHVQADLKVKCHLYGKKTEVYKFAYYNNDSHLLYVHRFDDQVYRLNGETIELLNNGTDDVLFEHDQKFKSYKVECIMEENDLLDKHIIGRINFSDSIETKLTADEQRLLFRIWTYSIFFESIMPTKPIVLFLGVKGSGKTLSAKMIGKLLFGRYFSVNSISKEDDFDAVTSSSYLVAFDNVDAKKDWLNDRLAMAATGQVIEKRKLYTTNEVERYYPRCFLILTARTPEFKRDDVTERLLIFRVERLESFISEQELLGEMLKNRNAILTELFNELNRCIRKLKANSGEQYLGLYRMADFADFIYKVFDKDENVLCLLEKMDQEQQIFLFEDDPLIECIQIWLNDKNYGKLVSASNLFTSIVRIAKENNIILDKLSAISLGKRLTNERSNFNKLFDFTIQSRPGRAKMYVFNVKQEKP